MFVFETQARMGLHCVAGAAQRKKTNLTELCKQCASEDYTIEKWGIKQRNSEKA